MNTIADLARGYRDGGPSPVEIVGHALDAIAADEPRLNAVATLLHESAMADAARARDELAAGRDRGPLHGIPVAVKDLFAVAGVPTGFGAHPDFRAMPTTDAAVVARLRAAGAVLVATTNMLEFAYGAVQPLVGQTNNPRDPARTSGGSSGGSAALVAAGHVPVAVGTDTGGSIRIPAAYCGIVGMKPSYGLVNLTGGLPLSWSLDHAGPLAGCVADARLMLQCLSGVATPASAVPLAGLRLGVIAAYRNDPCMTLDARRAFADACAVLVRHGATLTDVEIPGLRHASNALMLIMLPEASAIHANRLAQAPQFMAPSTRLQLDAGAALPAVAYVRARQFRTRLRAAFAAVFETVDALLSPTVPFAAPFEDPPVEQDGGSAEMLCTAPANLAGPPALSLPFGRSAAGLPLGLHITAASDNDFRLLDIAVTIEAVLATAASQQALRRPVG